MADDELFFSKPAGHARSKMAAVGGTLAVKQGRLVFEPNAMAKGMGAERWSRPLGYISAATTAGRDPLAFMAGGMKRRLVVELDDGTRELFTVSRAEKAAEELQAVLDAERP